MSVILWGLEWTKQCELLERTTVDLEVKLAKIIQGLISLYEPKALDTLKTMLDRLRHEMKITGIEEDEEMEGSIDNFPSAA